jgi:small multidrug resistance pump
MPKAYLILLVAVVFETIGTAALQASQQFTKPIPSIIVVIGYGIAFYMMALTLKVLPVGITYAVWSGLGIISISIIAYFAFGQKLDLAAILGMGLIVAGILVINLFSKTAVH